MKIVATRDMGREYLIEMDDGTARVLDMHTNGWVGVVSADSVLVRGGFWLPYDGDENPAELLERAHPQAVVV